VKHQAFVSLVVYLHNERDTITDFLRKADLVLDETFEHHEIIVVDDTSTDGSAGAVADTAPSLKGSTTLLELARHHGVEAAILAGLERSVGDFVFELETSLIDFHPRLVRELFEVASTGIDIVAAGGDKGSRKSRWFYRILNRYGNLGVQLASERVRLVSRRALNAMLGLKEKVRYRKALYALTGFPHQRLTSQFGASRNGAERRVNRETVGLAFDVLLSFSSFGLRVAHWLSLAFTGFSVLVILYSIGVFLFLDNVVSGWTTLMIVISLGLAGLFLILGIIGEYLARILIEVRGRPLYALRSSRVFHPAPPMLEVSEGTGGQLLRPPSFVRSQLEGTAPDSSTEGERTSG
jgi:polyisoprenyl-phosphate glycosyltransferase